MRLKAEIRVLSVAFTVAIAFQVVASANFSRSLLIQQVGCKDLQIECKQWAAHGECFQNPYFMRQHCKQVKKGIVYTIWQCVGPPNIQFCKFKIQMLPTVLQSM